MSFRGHLFFGYEIFWLMWIFSAMHGGSGAMMAAQGHEWPTWQFRSFFHLASLAVQEQYLAVTWQMWRYTTYFLFFLAIVARQCLHKFLCWPKVWLRLSIAINTSSLT
jgi:hypothetical protein